MSKRKPITQYRITAAVRGAFVGSAGRIHYEVQPGTVSEQDIDPEALALLLEGGFAVDLDASTTEAESDVDAEEAPSPAESEDST